MSSGSARYDFTDAVVLVTGGGTGIGLAITRAFLASGATVVVTGRRKDALDEALRDAPADRAVAITADVADKAQVGDLVDEVVRRFGRLDVVVSNAAGYVNGALTDTRRRRLGARCARRTSTASSTSRRRTLPLLAESGGNLVAVSSVSGLAGDWGQAGYNATKAAVSNFVRSLALDWGPAGVRLNAVAPALTRTGAVAAVTEDPALTEKFVDRVALGRIGEPEDIAPAVLFLASDAARYVTGVVLPVDGGTSASTGQARG